MPSSSSQNSEEPRGLLYIALAAFAFFVGLFSQPRPRQHESTISNEAETERQENRATENMNVVRAELYTPEHIERQRQADQNRAHALQIWLTVGTWLAFIAAAVYAGLTARMLSQIKEQTRIQRDTFDLSQRPWIVSEFAARSLIFKEDGVFLDTQFRLTNTGHSLAESISVWTRLNFDEETLQAEKEKICTIPELPENANYDSGSVLFAGQQRISSQTALGELSNLKKALTDGPLKDMKMVTISLITCVDYKYSFDSEKRHHRTTIVYRLTRPDSQSGTKMGVFDPHGIYSPNQFTMNPGQISGD